VGLALAFHFAQNGKGRMSDDHQSARSRTLGAFRMGLVALQRLRCLSDRNKSMSFHICGSILSLCISCEAI
jgi:hypothetical protein